MSSRLIPVTPFAELLRGPRKPLPPELNPPKYEEITLADPYVYSDGYTVGSVLVSTQGVRYRSRRAKRQHAEV